MSKCLTGMYQWVWELNKLHTFNWYVGVGPQLSSLNRGFALAGLGQLGFEYNFKIPFQLSVDYRPGYYFSPHNFGGSFEAVSLSLRYKF